jgi:uncharacterized membrane protein YvlD (DUF360 family)
MISLAVGIVVAAIVLQLLGGLIPGVHVDGIEAAFWTAVILTVIEFGAFALWEVSGVRLSLWGARAFHVATSTLALGIATLVVERFKVHNPISLVVLAAALTAISVAVQSVLAASL